MSTDLTKAEFIESWVKVDSKSNPSKLLDNIEKLYSKNKTDNQLRIITNMRQVLEKGVV